MKLEDVKPRRWTGLRILFDDGNHGIVSGYYDGGERRVIGLRYNGEGEGLGYPNARGYPTYFHFFKIPAIELALLNALKRIVSEDPTLNEKYGQEICEELDIFKNMHVEEIKHHIRTQEEGKLKEELEKRIQEKILKEIEKFNSN